MFLQMLCVFFGVLIMAYVALYFIQDRLLFFPQPLLDRDRTLILTAFPDAEYQISVSAETIQGWLLQTAKTDTVLLYFGGNAEEISFFLLELHRRLNLPVIGFNYRGYGKSSGQASQQNLFHDALKIYDHFKQYPQIIVIGRSLGTGVASYLASQRKVHKVILITPYDSLLRLSQENYPWVPVKLLFKHPFESIIYAKKCDMPLLSLMAEYDTLIPAKSSQRLLAHWAGEKRNVLIPGRHHNDLQIAPQFWQSIGEFIDHE